MQQKRQKFYMYNSMTFVKRIEYVLEVSEKQLNQILVERSKSYICERASMDTITR